MAKIVPGIQYTDIQEYDAFDDFLKVFEIAQKAGGMYQTAKASTINNINDGLKSAMDLMGEVSSDDAMANLTNQIDMLNQRAGRYGNDATKLYASSIKSIQKNNAEDFKHFKEAFNNILYHYEQGGMFSEENFTAEKIKNWNVDDITKLYDKMRSNYSKISTPSHGYAGAEGGIQPGKLKFQGFRQGDEDVSTVKAKLDGAMNRLIMGIRSMQGDGRVTEEEANFIIAGSPKELSNYRTKVINHSRDKIKHFAISSSKASQAIHSLETKKDLKVFDIAQENTFVSRYADDMDLNMQQSIAELQGTAKGQELYNDLIKSLTKEISDSDIAKATEIARFNAWSPVQWDPIPVPPPDDSLIAGELGETGFTLKEIEEGTSDVTDILKSQYDEEETEEEAEEETKTTTTTKTTPTAKKTGPRGLGRVIPQPVVFDEFVQGIDFGQHEYTASLKTDPFKKRTREDAKRNRKISKANKKYITEILGKGKGAQNVIKLLNEWYLENAKGDKARQGVLTQIQKEIEKRLVTAKKNKGSKTLVTAPSSVTYD